MSRQKRVSHLHSIFQTVSILYFTLSLFTVHATDGWTIKTEKIEHRTEDGSINLEASLPVIEGGSQAAADNIRRALKDTIGIDAVIQKTKDAMKTHQDILNKKTIDSDIEVEQEDFPQDQNISFTVELNDGKLLSICFTWYAYSGGVHGGTRLIGCTFDAVTGKQMELNDLIGSDYKPVFHPLVKANLNDQKESLFPDWESSYETADYGFYLTPGMIVLFFPEYSIAPYASGIIKAEIPFDKLGALIKPVSPLHGYKAVPSNP